jgi:hypothetical protein
VRLPDPVQDFYGVMDRNRTRLVNVAGQHVELENEIASRNSIARIDARAIGPLTVE